MPSKPKKSKDAATPVLNACEYTIVWSLCVVRETQHVDSVPVRTQ